MALPKAPSVARFLLAAAVLVCAVGMVGPFQGVEQSVVPWDKAAHFIAFYGSTLLMFTAFPSRRRLDLVMLAVLAGCGIELAQQLGGRDAEVGDVVADAAGAFAVLAPIWLEKLRAPPRRERRRRRTAAPAAAGVRRAPATLA